MTATVRGVSRAIGGDQPIRGLLRWFWPYVRESRWRLALTVAMAGIVLAIQAVIPLQVESILNGGVWAPGPIALLTLSIAVLVAGFYATDFGAYYVAAKSAGRLRRAIFARALRVRVIRRDGLVRSSVVSRHTMDVDRVSEAFSMTVAIGFPAVIRILVSLTMLTVIEWRAGLVMTLATIGFILVRRTVGRLLLIRDRDRLSASSRVGESVDEAITSPRTIAGLRLEGWIESRFATRTYTLTSQSIGQGALVARLSTGAYAAGMLGLLAVVVFGVTTGGSGLASIAAALLYVEAVVAGLRVLPHWARSLNLAVVSRHRIDMVLTPEPHADNPDFQGAPRGQAFSVDTDSQPGVTHMVGLVTPVTLDRDSALTALSAGIHPDPWRITLDGTPIRMPGVLPHIVHVPADSVAFNVSVHEHLRSCAPDLSDEDAARLLESVGLAHLADLPGGLDRPLGAMASALTADERQRLILGTAIAAAPKTLLVGPLIALADPDTARPLVKAIRESGIESVVVAIGTPDTAAAMDSMILVQEHEILNDSHENLLVNSPEYARIWGQRLAPDDVDLSVLGLGEGVQENLYARLVTERFEPNDIIYRQGDLSDRIFFVVSGRVEISILEGDESRRVAVIGPGNHCGDLRLTVGERRAEGARAVDACVVRSLSRSAISAGLTGLLDRSETERRIMTCLLRGGPLTEKDLLESLPDVDPDGLASAIALLVQDGAVRRSGDVIHPVIERKGRRTSKELLDRIVEP
ncbi:MAG: cyclic nucleotide-binding domain-containing protein [Candidatus Nanopelagicales bacterium]